jgi:hypothetical protein
VKGHVHSSRRAECRLQLERSCDVRGAPNSTELARVEEEGRTDLGISRCERSVKPLQSMPTRRERGKRPKVKRHREPGMSARAQEFHRGLESTAQFAECRLVARDIDVRRGSWSAATVAMANCDGAGAAHVASVTNAKRNQMKQRNK